jgi:hypothetical protein
MRTVMLGLERSETDWERVVRRKWGVPPRYRAMDELWFGGCRGMSLLDIEDLGGNGVTDSAARRGGVEVVSGRGWRGCSQREWGR